MRGRYIIVLLVALFATPVVAASALFFSGWHPAASVVHGTLMQPPVPMGERFHGQWTLLYAGSAECAADCRHELRLLRQVHLALGREEGRVRRVFAAQGAMTPEGARELARVVPGLVVAGGGAWAGKAGVYLIDPQGNLILTYGRGADPSGIRRDLSRLLAYSWVG